MAASHSGRLWSMASLLKCPDIRKIADDGSLESAATPDRTPGFQADARKAERSRAGQPWPDRLNGPIGGYTQSMHHRLAKG